jgi:hypothetical protein
MKKVRVKIKNNWECYEYYVNNSKVDPKTIAEVYDKDGNRYPVKHKEESVSYSDMGHRYDTSRIVLCIDHPLGIIILREKSEFYIEKSL